MSLLKNQFISALIAFWLTSGVLAGLAMLLMVSPALGATFNVASEAALRTAIFTANVNGDPSNTINLTGNVTLTQSMPMITKNLTVNGGRIMGSG